MRFRTINFLVQSQFQNIHLFIQSAWGEVLKAKLWYKQLTHFTYGVICCTRLAKTRNMLEIITPICHLKSYEIHLF